MHQADLMATRIEKNNFQRGSIFDPKIKNNIVNNSKENTTKVIETFQASKETVAPVKTQIKKIQNKYAHLLNK